jgi:hypothetical protein
MIFSMGIYCCKDSNFLPKIARDKIKYLCAEEVRME